MKANKHLAEEYLTLFNAVTDAEEQLSAITKKLTEAQQRAEELYISSGTKRENAFHLSCLVPPCIMKIRTRGHTAVKNMRSPHRAHLIKQG